MQPDASGARADPARIPVSELKGAGPVLAVRLAARGIVCLQDLWLHLPLRYTATTSN